MKGNYQPRFKMEVLVSIPVDNEPRMLGPFAELVDSFNRAITDRDLWAEIVHLKEGAYFLISKLEVNI